MQRILVFSEKDAYGLDFVNKAFELSSSLSGEVSAAVLGPDSRQRSTSYLSRGAVRAYVSEHSGLEHFDSNVYAQALAQIAQQDAADLILIPSTKNGRDTASRLAQKFDAGSLANALDVGVQEGKLITSRYGLGGLTLVTESLEAARKVIALLPQSTEQVASAQGNGRVIEVDLSLDASDVLVSKRDQKERESVDIEKSRVLVCVGRGLKRKEDLALVGDFASAIKGEIGCTKELASNLGWLSEDRIIGMSGKRCKPAVCYSIGVSGQSQHVAGIAGARTIMAINNDAGAPIFKVADYGIVGDLYVVLPKLIERIQQEKNKS